MEHSFSKEKYLDNQDLIDEEIIQPMPIRRIAEYVGKSFDWVQARIDQFSDQIIMLPDSRNHQRVNYSSVAIKALKVEADESRSYPSATENDISIYGLATVLQRREKWVASRLLVLGIEPTEKVNPVNNNIYGYYNKESELESLRQEDERIKSYPVATEDYGTVETLSQIMGHDRKWIRRRLRYIALIPTIMFNPGNERLDLYYPIELTLEQITELPNHHKQLKHSELNDIHPSEKSTGAVPRILSSRALDRQVVYEPDVIDASNWMSFAECAQVDPDIFGSLEKGGSNTSAKSVCGKCAVRLFCLDYALVNDIDTGIYGGLTPNQRKKLKSELKAVS